MATTSQTNVKKDKGVSKKGSAPTLKKNNAKEDGGLDAKEFCGKKNVQLTPTPTPEQVQKAKDFIWRNVPYIIGFCIGLPTGYLIPTFLKTIIGLTLPPLLLQFQ